MNTLSRLPILIGVLAIIGTIKCSAAGQTAQVAGGAQSAYERVAGNYQLAKGQDFAINLFTGDGGKTTLLYTNYDSG